MQLTESFHLHLPPPPQKKKSSEESAGEKTAPIWSGCSLLRCNTVTAGDYGSRKGTLPAPSAQRQSCGFALIVGSGVLVKWERGGAGGRPFLAIGTGRVSVIVSHQNITGGKGGRDRRGSFAKRSVPYLPAAVQRIAGWLAGCDSPSRVPCNRRSLQLPR